MKLDMGKYSEGLSLDLYARRGTSTGNGVIAARAEVKTVTLVAVVDSTSGQQMVKYVDRVFKVRDDSPAVVLVIDKGGWNGEIRRHLMPVSEGGELEFGRWAAGPLFANGDSRFWELIDRAAAVKLHDYDVRNSE